MDQAARNQAYVRAKVAERGWTREVEAQAIDIISDALTQIAANIVASWTELYFRAYQDGINVHHMSGHRLTDYAHCYADVNEDHSPISLEQFWGEWLAGAFEHDECGGFHRIA
jgi:hypothetical protein